MAQPVVTRGSGEGQRDREDFEHGLDHLGKIFTWVLLQGLVKRLEQLQRVVVTEHP